jgi:hypothetical protein
VIEARRCGASMPLPLSVTVSRTYDEYGIWRGPKQDKREAIIET